jgi:hypothetical protein
MKTVGYIKVSLHLFDKHLQIFYVVYAKDGQLVDIRTGRLFEYRDSGDEGADKARYQRVAEVRCDRRYK